MKIDYISLLITKYLFYSQIAKGMVRNNENVLLIVNNITLLLCILLIIRLTYSLIKVRGNVLLLFGIKKGQTSYEKEINRLYLSRYNVITVSNLLLLYIAWNY